VKFLRSTCPRKSGCFLTPERDDFSRHSSVQQLVKNDAVLDAFLEDFADKGNFPYQVS
jgi:hypothetical protein